MFEIKRYDDIGQQTTDLLLNDQTVLNKIVYSNADIEHCNVIVTIIWNTANEWTLAFIDSCL